MTGSPALQPLPADVRRVADYEAHARAVLDDAAWSYLAEDADAGRCTVRNREGWDTLRLVPRMLRGVRSVDTRTDLLGRTLPWPVLAAPMALQRLAHPQGEAAMALATSALGAGMVLGSQASMTIEHVAAAFRPDAAEAPLWFQLYLLADRGASLELVRRAEAAGCSAIVLTVDAGVRAARTMQLPAGITPVNLPRPAAAAASLQDLLALAPSWDDVAWLQSATRLPVLLKGILHPEDAREALRQGVAGLVVSNHGGRILEAACSTAAALPAVVDAVGGGLPVLVDGGIQRGSDVVKALALGARAVLLGRPLLWGLAVAGAAGAAHVLRLLRDELELCMAQCGAGTPAQLGPTLLASRPLQR